MKITSPEPLSECAKHDLSNAKEGYIFTRIFAIGLLLIPVMGFCIDGVKFALIALAIHLAVFVPAWFFSRRNFREKVDRILSGNKADYLRSQKLIEVLGSFTSSRSTDFGVIEESVGESWRPFRVEHFLSESLRGEIVGSMGLVGSIFRGFRGGFSASIQGSSVPNLLDSSSIIFFRNDQGETLRALIPSPRVTREMLTKTIEHWIGKTPYNSHTRNTLQGFSLQDENLTQPITHPKVIDSINASCDSPIGERDEVRVFGSLVQDGVIVVSALESKGGRSIFLPSGFFKSLVLSAAPVLGYNLEAPKTAEAA